VRSPWRKEEKGGSDPIYCNGNWEPLLFSDFYEPWENRMKKTTKIGVIIAVCLVTASLVPVSAAIASTTENECARGGGYVAAGAGCKFCVGGKFDLSEIKDAGKNNPTQAGSDHKSSDKASDQSGTGTPANKQL
jgi:hypothetical protein